MCLDTEARLRRAVAWAHRNRPLAAELLGNATGPLAFRAEHDAMFGYLTAPARDGAELAIFLASRSHGETVELTIALDTETGPLTESCNWVGTVPAAAFSATTLATADPEPQDAA